MLCGQFAHPGARKLQRDAVLCGSGMVHRGIRPDNAAQFAASGVDVLVTSSLYSARAADFGAVMRKD